MRSVLVSMIAAFAISVITTPLVRVLAQRLHAFDDPTARRVHVRRVPRLGGIALVLGFFIPQLLLFVLDTDVSHLLFQKPQFAIGMVLGSAILVMLGALDDTRGLSAKTKLAVQSLAAFLAYACGFRIDAISLPGIGVVELGVLALPATWLWITAVVNALNFIDGLDGLAAGIALFACITNLVVAWLGGNILICLFSATLIGALLGFLIYNFNPATIFMGDCGSMFLGFVLATTSLHGAGSYKSSTAIALIVPLLALGVPIMDLLVAMTRRFLARRSIFSPDRGHIHHRLLDAGLTQRRAVLILYGLCAAFTLGALAISLGRSWQIGLALTVLAVSVIGTSRFVGYFNQGLLRTGRRWVRGPDAERFRLLVPGLLQEVANARSRRQVCEVLASFAGKAQLTSASLSVAPGSSDPTWRWDLEGVSPKISAEAVSVSFLLHLSDGSSLELGFAWDCAEGEVSPQAEIMLQLVADAVERALLRTADGVQPADAVSEEAGLRLAEQR